MEDIIGKQAKGHHTVLLSSNCSYSDRPYQAEGEIISFKKPSIIIIKDNISEKLVEFDISEVVILDEIS